MLAARPALAKVCAVASFLVDGQKADDATALTGAAEVDVLPPFAGGAPLVVGIGGSTNPASITARLVNACLAEYERGGPLAS